MATAEELLVAIRSEGADDTVEDLDNVEEGVEETSQALEKQSEEMQGFATKFKGALTAAVAALALGAAGLLSKVPVIGEALGGLGAIIDSVGLQIDSEIRPALQSLTSAFFDIAQGISEADGGFGDLIGRLGAVGAGATLVIGVLTAIGVTLTGPLLLAIGAVAGAIAALWTAWDENFANIQGVTQSVIGSIQSRFQRFAEVVGPIVSGVIERLAEVWQNNGDTIVSTVNFVFRTVGAVIEQVVDSILTTIQFFFQVLTGDWEGAWNTLTNFFERTISRWKPILSDAIKALKGLIVDAAQAAANITQAITEKIVGMVEDAIGWGEDLIQNFIQGIENKISNLQKTLNSVDDKIKSKLSFDIEANDRMARGWGSDLLGEMSKGMRSELPTINQTVEQVEKAAEPSGSGLGGRGNGNIITMDGRRLDERTGRYGKDRLTRRGI